MKQAYTLQDVATLFGISTEVAQSLVRLVFGQPRDLLSQSDLVLVREAHALAKTKLPKQRIVSTLNTLRTQLQGDRPTASVTVGREGKELVIGEGHHRWNAESGQALLNLSPTPARGATWLRPVQRGDTQELFEAAVALEAESPQRALEAYSDVLAANPHHADAHLNLGRLLHHQRALREAEAHYVAALVVRPTDVTATFNLAVVLEDLGRADEAIVRYREAIELDPGCVDAYFNLARLYEQKGEKLAAIRHLKDYRRLTSPR
jgi:tetratricopeptide (TPR) repeat protein